MAVPVNAGEPLPGAPYAYNADLEHLEIELLLEGVYRHYGFDFRSYAYASIRRRLWKRVEGEGLRTISDLQARILHDPDAMERLLLDLSVNVTAMFRDPSFYREFRQRVIPLLRTYPFIRIWHAGCSTGEEPYTIAMLILEMGCFSGWRVEIIGTDISHRVLQQSRKAVYSKSSFRTTEEHYIKRFFQEQDNG
ncbi:MAG: CheR family methyltransferase, partial [Thermoanaerobaculia bacterium]